MLKVRVIPTMLLKDVGLVKGESFNSWRRVGTAMPAVKVYNTRQVDELMLMDITATEDQREPDYELVEELAQETFVPFTVGGGITNIEQIRRLLKAGADKVSINSAAYENPQLIREAAERFGRQCIVVSIDARKEDDGCYRCYRRSGKQQTSYTPGEWATQMEEMGAGEILITSIERDGTLQGYDLELIREVTTAVHKIPVIASGGAGEYEDFRLALVEGCATAVAAASMFHFTQQTPMEAKNYLAKCGIPVRNSIVQWG